MLAQSRLCILEWSKKSKSHNCSVFFGISPLYDRVLLTCTVWIVEMAIAALLTRSATELSFAAAQWYDIKRETISFYKPLD